MSKSTYDYEVHPLAKLFPLLPAEEYQKLKADIKAHGQLEPIMLSKDGTILLDGRNRLRACKELGISTLTTVLSDGAESDYIWAKNVLRRHLTADQRAAIAHKWSDTEKEAAADQQKASQAKPGEKVGSHKVRVKTPAPSKDRHATRKAIAKKAQVSEHKVKQAAVVAKRSPELLAKVEAGEITLKDAAAKVTPPDKVKVKMEPPTVAPLAIVKVAGEPPEVLKQVTDKIREAISAWPKDRKLAPVAEVFTVLLHLFETIGLDHHSMQVAWHDGFDKWWEQKAKAEVRQ